MIGSRDADDRFPVPSPPGQMPVILAALSIGILLMAVQLWLLTVALDLYLAGNTGRIWWLAVVSGVIFLGGILMFWLLTRRPRIHRLGEGEPPGAEVNR